MPEQRHSIPVPRPLTTHLFCLHGAPNSSFTVVNIFLLTSNNHWDSETSSLQPNYTAATCCCNWFLPQRQEPQQSPGGLPGFGQFTDIPPHPRCPHDSSRSLLSVLLTGSRRPRVPFLPAHPITGLGTHLRRIREAPPSSCGPAHRLELSLPWYYWSATVSVSDISLTALSI